MDDGDLLGILEEAAAAVRRALDDAGDWGPSGRPGQYRSDLAADAAALEVLLGAGVSVLSEETGHHDGRGANARLLAVVDPLDGSTNAAHGIPWYATSLCVLDGEGPRAALVVEQPRGTRYSATRGGGAQRDGTPIHPSTCIGLGDALVGLAGLPPADLGWRQFRALGAAALDLCLVAAGALDAYADFSRDGHGPWDYLAGLLICHEAGAVTAELSGRELLVTALAERRGPVAAATPELLHELLQAHAAARPIVPRGGRGGP